MSYDGKSVTYGPNVELAAAIADIERRIAVLERTSHRIVRPHAVKGL